MSKPTVTPRAAFNALLQEETKESLAIEAIDLLRQLREAKSLLDAREWHDEHCSGRFAICTMQRCARARLMMTPPPSERLSGEDFHFEDSRVMGMIQASEYYKEIIAYHLDRMTSGEKWSLYRAVVALADAQRKVSEPPVVPVASGQLCENAYPLNESHRCVLPKNHLGAHQNKYNTFSWLSKEPND